MFDYVVRFDGAYKPSSTKQITAIMAKVPVIVSAATSVGSNRVEWFFGKAVSENRASTFDPMAQKMQDYLGHKCSSITFVSRSDFSVNDKCAMFSGRSARVAKNAAITGQDPEGRFIYDEDFIPSGVRIQLEDGFFKEVLPDYGNMLVSTDRKWKLKVVMHELSHRILGTGDHWYGEQPALAAAKRGDPKCLGCADNWAYFFQSVSAELASSPPPPS